MNRISSWCRARWRVVVLGIALVAAVSVIGIHALDRSPGGPRPARELGLVPDVAWTLDVADLTDDDSQVLLAAPYTLSKYYGYGSPITSSSSIVAALGTPAEGDEASGRDVTNVTLVGVGIDDGSPTWSTAVGGVDQCSTQADSATLACWSDRRVVFVEISSGDMIGSATVDFDIDGVQTAGADVYVSGTVLPLGAPDDSRTPVLTRGTVDDVDAVYHRDFLSLGQYSYAQSFPAHAMTTVGTSNTLAGTSVTRVVDSGDGTSLFSYAAESLSPVSSTLLRAQNGVRANLVGTEELLDRSGATVTSVAVPSSSALTYVGARSDDSRPLFLGDGAYDATTGAELWRNPDMVVRESGGPTSAVKAVVGQTIIVTSPETQTITGIDVVTGVRRWQTPWQDAYWVRDGTADDRHYVFGDYTGAHAIDSEDGSIEWSVPLPIGADPREVRVGTAAGRMTVSWRHQFTVYR
ncbi:PQQ-binding-like beta-propeller repeat protein [Actinomycetes bacterium M1A6_2h]